MQTISPEHLKEMLDGGKAPRLIDVRDPWEFELCRIPGSENIPMSELSGKLEHIDHQADLVLICHHGVRSRQVVAYLESAGFTLVQNLDGGVDGWAVAIDPDMPQY